MKAADENRFIRHRSYVDLRIEILSSFIDRIDSPSIKTLIEHVYGFNDLSLSCHESDIIEACDDLKNLFSRWNILSDGDLGGYMLQSLASRDEKKNRGQFFTPPDIVREMIRMLAFPEKPVESWKILDPACGSGQFLLGMFQALLEIYVLKGYSRYDAAKAIVSNNLFGNDIDQVAMMVARFNLSQLSGIPVEEIHITCSDFLFRDDLSTSPGLVQGNEYDIIIGNPPWGSKLTSEQKKYFRHTYLASESGINTFTLFLERSFDYLGQHGQMAFLVPEAYLNIKAHQRSRQWVLDSFMIKAISLWGEQFRNVFAPSISILMKKQHDPALREKCIIEIHKPGIMSDKETTLVPQGSYMRNTENIFNVHYSRKAVDILSAINNSDSCYLRNRSTFFLGIVTGNNHEHILPFPSDDYPDPIIVGRDLEQYRINYSDHYFRSDAGLQQVAPRHLYQKKNKILYRFIGKKLTFAVDREGYYMLNNVNGLIPEIDELSVHTIVSLLNSSVLQYYYEKTFFTLKVLRGNLEQLPLRRISRENQRKIEKLVLAIMEKDNTFDCIERYNLEDIFFHEYGMRDSDAHHIWDSMQNASPGRESLKAAHNHNQVFIASAENLPVIQQ